MKPRHYLLPLLLLSLAGLAVQAEEGHVAAPGKLLYELPARQVPPNWKGFGKQELVDDAWQISENPDDHHPAAPKIPSPAQNVVAEWEWRVPTARSVSFRFDTKGGHLCNVTWTPAADGKPGRLALGMLDYDKDQGPAKAELLEAKPCPAPRDQWLKMRWEMLGDQIQVKAGDLVLRGQREAIARPKTTVAFTVPGGAAQVCNLKLWEAQAPQGTP